MITTCPRCFTADDISARRLPGRMLEYTCTAGHDGTGEHTWLKSVAGATRSFNVEEGVTEELLQPLLSCVHPGVPLVEYGIVEYPASARTTPTCSSPTSGTAGT